MNGDDDKKIDPSDDKPKPGQLPTEDKPEKPAPNFQDGMKEDGSPNQ